MRNHKIVLDCMHRSSSEGFQSIVHLICEEAGSDFNCFKLGT